MQFINLLIGEPAQWRTQHADQRQAIERIFHRAQEVHRVDDFLGGVKMALAFDDVTNALAAQRFQVIVNIGELAKQNGDVFCLNVDAFTAGVENARLV